MTTIAATPGPLWGPGCSMLDVGCVALPWSREVMGGPYGADLSRRLELGRESAALLARRPAELMLDLAGAGLMFVEGPGGLSDLKLLHERLGVPLVSHFVDPVALLNRGLSWDVLVSCLGSRRWIKLAGDAPHAEELSRLGVPGVAHLPPAAPDMPYDARPVDPSSCMVDVRLIGDSSASLFARPGEDELCGAAISAAVSSPARLPFHTLYFDVDRVAALPTAAEPAADRVGRIAAYFHAKSRFAAAVCRHQRDLCIRTLAERYGGRFSVCGRGWEGLGGCLVEAAPATPAAYLAGLRGAAINVVVGDGWSESTISSHHFEVAASGGFLLCAHHPQVSRYFEPGLECETFHDEEELLTKIAYYLAHPQERIAVAQAGQRKALRQHLTRHRLEAILRIVEAEGLIVAKAAGPVEAPRLAAAPWRAPVPAGTSAAEEKLLVLLNPGRMSRHSLVDMVDAARGLGVPTVTHEMGERWGSQRPVSPQDEAEFGSWLRRERVRAVLSLAANGSWEWSAVVRPGEAASLIERMGIPRMHWWTDHPQWTCEKVALTPEIQPFLATPGAHHFLKSGMAAAELRDVLGWTHAHGLPVGENPDRLRPVEGVAADYDVVAIMGSPPRMHAEMERFLESDDPDPADMAQVAARDVLHDLDLLWSAQVPAELRTELADFGLAWTEARLARPLDGSHRLFLGLEREHLAATRFLRAHPRVYFDAVEALWQLAAWQRTFCVRYLARHFRVGVFGSDWSKVGLGAGSWIDHDEQARVYARGRVAINVSQAGDEEGLAHKPFHIAASGVPMVHVLRRGLSDCFAPGPEVSVFQSPREAREAVAELLEDPGRRAAMAEAARARLCGEHTWRHRLRQMFTLAGVGFAGVEPLGAIATDGLPVVAEGRGERLRIADFGVRIEEERVRVGG